MTIIHQIISDAEFEYDPQETRMIIPVRNIRHHPDKVRASELDSCELKHAYSKRGVKGIPEVMDQNRSLKHLFKMGEYAAYLIQESLMYKALRNPHMSFMPEVDLHNDHMKLAGRADGVLKFNNTEWIVEIKNTEGKTKRSVGDCRYSYALQTIAYMLMAGIDNGVIITTSKWKVSTYEVRRQKQILKDQKNASFLIYDENDEILDKTWNNIDDLSYQSLMDKVDTRLNVMTDVSDWLVDLSYSEDEVAPPKRPIEDPFNDPNGWQCFWKFDEGRHVRPPLRPAKAIMNCPYADMCYGIKYGEVIFVTKDKNGNWEIPEKLSEEYEDDGST